MAKKLTDSKVFIVLAAVAAIAALSIFLVDGSRKDGELKKEIGQMMIIGFRGAEAGDGSYIIKSVKNLRPGGVILFDKDNPSGGVEERNIKSPAQVKELISSIKAKSETPVFVAVDAEGGYINRLKKKYGFENIPSAEEMGKADDPAATEEQAKLLGAELKDLGFNMDFAPVVDVNVNPDNPVIGYLERSFSSDPEKVYENASAFIKGLHEYGIATAIKHFPGHGSSTGDSHLGMVDVIETYQENELLPYEKLIGDGYSDMIMTAHIMNRSIDPDYPATLSPLFIKNILRERLGFDGVIISDDMQMGAIVNNYGLDEAAVLAVKAGCDMLIVSNNGSAYNENDPYEISEAIFRAVKSGEISRENIDASYARIMSLKQKYGI